MDIEQPTISSDSGSADFADALDEPAISEDFPGGEEEQQQKCNIISELREELKHDQQMLATTNEDGAKDKLDIPHSSGTLTKNASFNSVESGDLSASMESLAISSSTSANTIVSPVTSDDNYDYTQDNVWRKQKKHIFVLSEAGKPIFTLHGQEDKLAPLFGVIQALVSFVEHNQDSLTSIHAGKMKFVFLARNSLILLAVSRTKMSVPQLLRQLGDVYNQIVSTITLYQLNKIFERRKNFDLRQLLRGSERLIHHLVTNDSTKNKLSNNVFSFLTNSVCVFPLPTAVRSNVVNAIQSNCSKIKNLVFAVLIADNKLITLVRMKQYSIQPSDLRLIFNLIECSESFKTSETWTPICLPKFDNSAYLYAHISYLADDCQACLLLLSVESNAFFTLSNAKQRIMEKLRKTNSIEAINEELQKRTNGRVDPQAIGIPEVRHFLFKPKGIAQLLCSDIVSPYSKIDEFEYLEGLYCKMFHQMQKPSCPLKLLYEETEREVSLGWITAAYEIYVVCEPWVEKPDVIRYIEKLVKWIEKDYDVFFIRNHPNF